MKISLLLPALLCLKGHEVLAVPMDLVSTKQEHVPTQASHPGLPFGSSTVQPQGDRQKSEVLFSQENWRQRLLDRMDLLVQSEELPSSGRERLKAEIRYLQDIFDARVAIKKVLNDDPEVPPSFLPETAALHRALEDLISAREKQFTLELPRVTSEPKNASPEVKEGELPAGTANFWDDVVQADVRQLSQILSQQKKPVDERSMLLQLKNWSDTFWKAQEVRRPNVRGLIDRSQYIHVIDARISEIDSGLKPSSHGLKSPLSNIRF